MVAKLGAAQRAAAPLLPQSMDQLTWLGLDAGRWKSCALI